MGALVNLYAEPVKNEGRTQLVLYPFPGKTLFSTIGGGSVRGQFSIAGKHYAVVGTTIYSIDSSGTALALDTIEGTALVDMDYNGAGQQLTISADFKTYSLDTTTDTVTEIVDPDLGGQTTSCCSINGYTIFTLPNTDIFKWSAVGDDTAIDALDFATAATKADFNVCARVASKALWIFGTNTIEFWYDSGDPLQAFQAYNVPAIEIGCASRDSVVLADTGFVWVGRDGRSGGAGVYRAAGFQATKISTPAVDRYLENYDDLSLARAFAFQFQGHLFYVLTLPDTVTLYYDLAAANWGYLCSGTWPMSEEIGAPWDSITFATNGQNRIVGASDGNLYMLDDTNLTEAGNPIIRDVTMPQIHHTGNRATLVQLEADMEFGVGNTNYPDPQIQACWSKDGGKTWSSPRYAGLGAVGKYKTRAQWQRCGAYRYLIPKFRISDAVTTAFLGAWANVILGG